MSFTSTDILFAYRVHFFDDEQAELFVRLARDCIASSAAAACAAASDQDRPMRPVRPAIHVALILSVDSVRDLYYAQWKTLIEKENLTDHVQVMPMVQADLQRRYPFYRGAWYHTQVQYMECYRNTTPHAYYWFYEYDVRHSDASIVSLLLDAHGARREDILAARLRNYETDPQWYWWDAESDTGDRPTRKMPLPIKECRACFMPVSRLSGRLLEKLVEQPNEWYAFTELYMPTMCERLFGSDSVGQLAANYVEHKDYTHRPLSEWREKLRDAKPGKLFHACKQTQSSTV